MRIWVGRKILKVWSEIRDFFFPVIDQWSEDEANKEDERRSKIEKEIKEYRFLDGEADVMLKFADEYEKREDARLHEVESKATVFIGTFSVAVTILMSLLKDFLAGSASGFLSATPVGFGALISFLLGLAIFYLCFAIINSVKTLQRNAFSTIGARETLNAGSYASILIEANSIPRDKNNDNHGGNKKAEIARKKLLYTFRNEKVINRKVDHMILAQAFFLHAVTVLILMLCLLAAYLIWQKVGDWIIDLYNTIINELRNVLNPPKATP